MCVLFYFRYSILFISSLTVYIVSPVSGKGFGTLHAMSKCAFNRTKVCGICTRKGTLRNISDTVLKMIRDHHFRDYDTNLYPSVICTGCDRILRFIDEAKLKGEDPKRKLPSISYEDKKAPPPRVTRAGDGESCTCYWCRVAGMNGPEYLIHAQSVRPPPKKSSPPKPRHVTRCERCYAVIGKGKRHVCTKTARNKNAKAMVRAFSTEGQKRHTSSLINSFCEEENIDKRTGTLTLNSGSKFKTINIGERKPLAQLKVSDLIKYGNENNYSDAALIKTGTLIRRVFGQNAMEKNLAKTLPKMKADMADFIELKQVQTVRQRKGKETIVETVPLVSVDDFRGFCTKAMAERGLSPQETDIIIGLDDGASLLKVKYILLSEIISVFDNSSYTGVISFPMFTHQTYFC